MIYYIHSLFQNNKIKRIKFYSVRLLFYSVSIFPFQRQIRFSIIKAVEIKREGGTIPLFRNRSNDR